MSAIVIYSKGFLSLFIGKDEVVVFKVCMEDYFFIFVFIIKFCNNWF